jgi:hypothetical protein
MIRIFMKKTVLLMLILTSLLFGCHHPGETVAEHTGYGGSGGHGPGGSSGGVGGVGGVGGAGGR